MTITSNTILIKVDFPEALEVLQESQLDHLLNQGELEEMCL